MKLSILGLAGALLLGAAPALDAQTPMESRLAAKLNEPWLKNAPWITDFDEAMAASKKLAKPIFAYFTRSYAP